MSESDTLIDDLEKALECSLCLMMICEPVSTSCGHTFCRVCLVGALRRNQKKCPSCRAVCHISAEDAPVNITIKNMCLILNPTLYNTRLQEYLTEKVTWNTVLPVFYYNQALFPGCKLSLHLFEPRYKVMMQRIINTTRAFAYVPNYTTYNASRGDIALVARLEDAEFLSDGRCMLEAKMAGRYTIIDHYVEQGTQGLHFCRLEPLMDDPLAADDIDIVNGYKNVASRILFSIFNAQTRSQIEERYGSQPADVSEFSLWMTALTPIPERAKAMWLSSKDTKGRLKCCIEAMTALITSSQLTPDFPTAVAEDGDEEEEENVEDGESVEIIDDDEPTVYEGTDNFMPVSSE